MAELAAATTDTRGCCSTTTHETCCAPEAKADCCAEHPGESCGCGGQAEVAGVREVVRERYAAAATAAGNGTQARCGDAAAITNEQREEFGSGLYESADQEVLPETARLASLGCGNPIAVADLREGETVLDLGSGGGIDVLLSARRVGPSGKAYGLDMTQEMLELARENQRQAGIENVEFLEGTIEDVPLPDASVDIVISNCVVNLSADKPAVFREAARVLRPGGRFAVTDVVADPDMADETRRDMAQWTGCIAGALTPDEFRTGLGEAGLVEVHVHETHRVHEHAGSAIIRATKPPPLASPPRSRGSTTR